MVPTVEPLRVSPFIKFCRWGLLVAGIFYGMAKYEVYSRKQSAIRAEYEKTRPEREARQKAEKERLLAEQMAVLSEATGFKW